LSEYILIIYAKTKHKIKSVVTIMTVVPL